MITVISHFARFNRNHREKRFLLHNVKKVNQANLIDIRCLSSQFINRFFSKLAIDYKSQQKVCISSRPLSRTQTMLHLFPENFEISHPPAEYANQRKQEK